ncbi:3-phosphoshikimate 1-carboxyvinyltransferase [Alkaliphilus hydrothermalis]|uniref:3-phosphoshikimate 1-carboxyvinyltransferase n=1 Tax=Alkaliphilus hydrothermalis TaxID=1482730 RepID=A0ABS2NLC3_9FIRM|nr:3-phosphoshikimate 1-carboxyvinyltransferase [Alkaliphilus hydrothermalis]MBM7613732.1 3-phosphoshikimate 1-carboxyvinyltransferase [Alkaliphilus hydrothermalis]
MITRKVHCLQGNMTVPGDKSISHRSIMLASISQGKSVITGFLRGEDCLSTIECFRGLGVQITDNGDEIIVEGKGINGLQEPKDILNAGNSGTTMRLMSGILAGQDFLSIMTGDDSLRSRPMARIASPLKEMGAKIDGRCNGKSAPLVIRGGNLKGIEYRLPVASAQVKSAVILAGLYADGTTTIEEPVPSRDHTERMVKAFGGNIKREGNKITVEKQELYGQTVRVPGDISSAAFFMVAAAAKENSHLRIKNVGLNPTRTGIIDVLKEMGADIKLENLNTSGGEEIGDIIIKGGKLKGATIGGEIIPRLIDEIPIIVVAAALAEGTTLITGAEELKHKESNRILTVVEELTKLGIKIEELSDGMMIHGPNIIKGGTVNSYGDHRIAMALAICGLFSEGPVKIENSECIAVSFPNFEETLRKIIF